MFPSVPTTGARRGDNKEVNTKETESLGEKR